MTVITAWPCSWFSAQGTSHRGHKHTPVCISRERGRGLQSGSRDVLGLRCDCFSRSPPNSSRLRLVTVRLVMAAGKPGPWHLYRPSEARRQMTFPSPRPHTPSLFGIHLLNSQTCLLCVPPGRADRLGEWAGGPVSFTWSFFSKLLPERTSHLRICGFVEETINAEG